MRDANKIRGQLKIAIMFDEATFGPSSSSPSPSPSPSI